MFLVSAFALLGTPGPGIAALLAIGKLHGIEGSLRFFTGLQAGLAIVAGACASGLLSVLSSLPLLTGVLTLAAILYLGWLAWSIAMSPVGSATPSAAVPTTFTAGLLLGISNPKAYLAFVTLFASQTLVSSSHTADAASKWGLTIATILIVDIAWLYAGVRLGRVSLGPRAERRVNMALGLAIALVALYSLLAECQQRSNQPLAVDVAQAEGGQESQHYE
jgi:threonine/homoserine/homoserine lactone efflux protein